MLINSMLRYSESIHCRIINCAYLHHYSINPRVTRPSFSPSCQQFIIIVPWYLHQQQKKPNKFFLQMQNRVDELSEELRITFFFLCLLLPACIFYYSSFVQNWECQRQQCRKTPAIVTVSQTVNFSFLLLSMFLGNYLWRKMNLSYERNGW